MTQMDQDRRQALTGRAYCSECHSTMLRMGPDYVCPSRVNLTAASCTNNSINAGRLLRLVATHIVRTVMVNPTTNKITHLIQEEARDTAKRFQDQLDQTERSLADLHRQEEDVYSEQDEAGEDAPDLKNDLNNITNKRAALSYEARNTRRELDAQTFISDEARIRANARDVDTFLDEAAPEDTIEFINNFVQSIGVGTWSIDLNYKFPIPSEDFPEGNLTYVIPRAGSDQTGVTEGNPEEPPQTPATPLPSGITNG